MKKIFAFIAVAIGLNSCGLLPSSRTIICNGPVQEVTMDKFKNYSDVTIDGSASVTFKQANGYNVSVRANQEVFDHIDYRLSGKNLVIGTERFVTLVPEVYDVFVQAPWFTSMVVNGSADIWMTEGYVSTTDLAVVVNGTSNINFTGVSVPTLDIELNGTARIFLTDIFVDKLYITLRGIGSVEISGSADYASITISGSASVDATDLTCGRLEKNITGTGTIKL